MEAAETTLNLLSALMQVEVYDARGVPWRKLTLPSMIIWEKGVCLAWIALTARRVASLRVSEMPIWSSSGAGTQPRPVVEVWRMRALSFSRFLAVSFLESSSSANQSSFWSGRMTAPTTSGPARGPRPTSSIPRIGIKLLLPRRILVLLPFSLQLSLLLLAPRLGFRQLQLRELRLALRLLVSRSALRLR